MELFIIFFENIILGFTIMFFPVSDNVLIMWMCYVCGLVCELGVHIPKPKKIHDICRQKPLFIVHAPPCSLKDSNVSLKVKIMKEK
jgi:hypothetical protein